MPLGKKKPTVTTLGHNRGHLAIIEDMPAGRCVARQCGPAAAPDHRDLPRVP